MNIVNKYKHAHPGPLDVWVMRDGSNKPTNGGRSLSCLSNPFHIGRDGDRATVVKKYRQWLGRKVKGEKDEKIISALRSIEADANLICCCYPLSCHAEVIRDACDYLRRNTE